MTNTDTPRTTAPAPEGDVLTAEQIAGEPMCRCEGCGMFWMPEYPGNDETCIECGGTISQEPSHVLMEIGAHAALRDRLARVEERERGLTENIYVQHAELAESVATTNALVNEQVEIAKLLRTIRYSALAGAEGRNVTSYEAGLKDALKAAEAALRIVEDAAPTDGAAPPRREEGESNEPK
jgi:hypothetical protein